MVPTRCEGLGPARGLVRYAVGNRKCVVGEISRRNAEELGHPAGLEPRRPPYAAVDESSRAALLADEAGSVMVRDDAVADRKSRDARTERGDLAGDLVSEHRSGLASHVPVQQVGTADPRDGEANYRFAGAGLRSRHLDDLDAAVAGELNGFQEPPRSTGRTA